MPSTVQEELLQKRLRMLDGFDARASKLSPGDEAGKEDLARIQTDIAAQRSILSEELDIRSQYRSVAEANQALRDHEALKAKLRSIQAQRRLSDDEIRQYKDSAADCARRIRNAGINDVQTLNTQTAAGKLKKRRDDLQKKYNNLKKSHKDLYQNSNGVASPCMPCISQDLETVSRNIKHKKRADKSKLSFNGKQNNKDTCALMSIQSILLESKGAAPPEGWSIKPSMWALHSPTSSEIIYTLKGNDDLIDIGAASGGYTPCNGTRNVAAVMTSLGIPATNTRKPSLEDFASALDDGKGVIAGYDARPVWYGTDKSKWSDQNPAGHAVRVTGVERNLDRSIRGFYINDSGDGTAGRFVQADTFQMALDGLRGGIMATSNSPITSPVP